MNENTKTFIEELKKVVLDLHRSAGQLDEIIQSIETEMENNDSDKNYMDMYISHMLRYRLDAKDSKGYNQLETRELAIWDQLIKSRLE